jgi:hypothetical protein
MSRGYFSLKFCSCGAVFHTTIVACRHRKLGHKIIYREKHKINEQFNYLKVVKNE